MPSVGLNFDLQMPGTYFMTSPLRLAFVGIDHPHGAGWRELLLNLADEVQLVAYVPGFDGGTTSLEERHAAAARYETIDELLAAGRFDAAIVCLPNNESPQAAAALARAGKHVLLEKPGAGSATAAKEIVTAVERAGLVFQSGYTWRYDEAVQRLRDMVAGGRFGKLTSVEMSFHTSDVAHRGPDHYVFNREQSQAGFFNWLACHWLDLLLYVTRQRVVGVTAKVGVFGPTPTDMEDGGVAMLELEEGGLATFIGGYWLPRWSGESHWCLRGAHRWVHWDPTRPRTGGVLEIHGPKPQWHAMEETFTVPADSTRGYGGANGLALVREWLQQIAAGGQCRNTASSLLATLELIDAIYESSRSGRRVQCSIGGE